MSAAHSSLMHMAVFDSSLWLHRNECMHDVGFLGYASNSCHEHRHVLERGWGVHGASGDRLSVSKHRVLKAG